MGTFFLFVVIGIIITIVIAIISTPSSKSVQQGVAHNSQTSTTPTGSTSSPKTSTSNPITFGKTAGNIGIIIFLIILLGLAIWIISAGLRSGKKFINDSTGKHTEINTRNQGIERPNNKTIIVKDYSTLSWAESDTLQIAISGSPKHFKLGRGVGLSFRNATQPYCVVNESRIPVCGIVNQDISRKLDKTFPNLDFEIYTSNKEDGMITLVHWKMR